MATHFFNKTVKDLLEKYDVPGPRYTSYPTVPDWSNSITQDQWIAKSRDAIIRGNKKGQGIAIYVHVPFCKSLCSFCGCFQKITMNETLGSPYVDQVLMEWKNYRDRWAIDSDIKIREIHFGGGTPTFLSAADLEKLTSGLVAGLQLSEDYEFSIEVDPRRTNKEQLATLAKIGFKRISLGVQDFDPEVQRVIHRNQSFEQVELIESTARSVGFSSVNFDLIYGLPKQTLNSIGETFDKVIRLRPDRLAFYSYAHVPWMKPAQKLFTEADLPQGEEKRALYCIGRDRVLEAGYKEIGMDHFALPTDSLREAFERGELHRNFMGYTSRASEFMVGLGLSSIGDSWDAFAQNTKSFEDYERIVKNGGIPIEKGHMLDKEDLMIRRHILNLMCQYRTNWETKETRLEDVESLTERLQKLELDDLVELTRDAVEITEKGRPFLRNVCMAFDVRLLRRGGGSDTKRFSRTI